MSSNVIDIVNGVVVPIHFPTSFTPSELDKLGITASITLSFVSVLGAFILVIGTKDWKKYSYTSLCIAWLLSVAAFAYGIFVKFGSFGHLMTFLAIVHIQIEWLIISYLWGFGFVQGLVNAAVVGFILTFAELFFESIRPGFALTSIVGGWGDVYIPLLIYNGGQHLISFGAASHFMNALVTFVFFVYYIPVNLYLSFELLFGTMYVWGTVVGILRAQPQAIALDLERDSERDAHPSSSALENGSRGNGQLVAGKDAEYDHIIPPPTLKDAIKWAFVALVLSFAVSLPLNFAPKP